MIKRFSETEMLAYWKRRLGLAATPGVTGTADANQLDAKLLDDIRAWYADLLLTAPRQLLPCEDLKEEADGRYAGENCLEIILPERGVRFVSVKLEAWDAPVDFAWRPDSRRAALQRRRETWATPDAPVVVEGVHRIFVHGLPSGMASDAAAVAAQEDSDRVPPFRPLPGIDSLMMVAAPADGSFELDPSLLKYGILIN